ncbi:MAG TPA: methionyl-tRNA formyltransferase [Ktedonobacterales bacterium]|nr:methionyl-tRNA formyltransferase [Ktedonobacterales bacterium]
MQIFSKPSLRVLFMGTPEFAVPSLAALVEHTAPGRLWATGLDLIGVATRPDKPAGRGRKVAFSPVKQYATEKGIPVFQRGSLRSPETEKFFTSLAPDVIIVAAFGQILPSTIIELPAHCCLNVHASLLPRHRGAAPISAAILAGDAETGVTIMLMDEGLDTGPILSQDAIPVAGDDTTGSLTTALATLGANLLIRTLPEWLAGGMTPRPQDDALATMTRPIRHQDCLLDWTEPAEEVGRQVRAYSPRPGAFTRWVGRVVKVLQAHPVAMTADRHEPGMCFVDATAGGLVCACGQGALALDVIQLEGKRALPAMDVLRGHPTLATATFS